MATEAETQKPRVESVSGGLPQAQQHWETHKHTSEAGLELANKNLARIALETSGQLRLEVPGSEEAA